jgi:hypothetical protein
LPLSPNVILSTPLLSFVLIELNILESPVMCYVHPLSSTQCLSLALELTYKRRSIFFRYPNLLGSLKVSH